MAFFSGLIPNWVLARRAPARTSMEMNGASAAMDAAGAEAIRGEVLAKPELSSGSSSPISPRGFSAHLPGAESLSAIHDVEGYEPPTTNSMQPATARLSEIQELANSAPGAEDGSRMLPGDRAMLEGVDPPRSIFRQEIAFQDAFERQHDRAMAEQIARQTGRDPDDVYRELRGLGPRRSPPSQPQPASRTSPSHPIRKPAPSPPLAHGSPTGWLAEIRETGGGGMSTISTGVNDPGGVSVGRFQLMQGSQRSFLSSNLGAKWRRELGGLRPGTPSFRQTWDRIVARDGAEFEKAQFLFLYRENYSPPATAARNSVRFDIAAANPVVSEVLWSMSNNVGPTTGRVILVDAIRGADRQFARSDRRHQEAVIQRMYSGWIDYVRRREAAERNRRPGTADQLRTMHTRTIPQEQQRAVAAYNK